MGTRTANRAELPVEHLRYPYAAEEDVTRRRSKDAEDGYYDDSNDEAIAAGAELSGKFSGDGLYYDVVVEEATENGYRVLFPGARSARLFQGSTCGRAPTAGDEFRYYDEEGVTTTRPVTTTTPRGTSTSIGDEAEATRRGAAGRARRVDVARARGGRRGARRFGERRATTSRSATCCSANSVDGQYYNVIVEEVTEAGYKVLFTEHEGEDGDREELPREHLRYYYPGDEGDDDEVGYPVEEGHDIAVGNNLLGKSGRPRYYDVVVEEVTETGYKVLFTASGDRGELPRSACASTTATRRVTSSRQGAAIAVGAELLGRKSDDGQYCDCVVEEVTETGCKVLFTAYDDGEGRTARNSRGAPAPPLTRRATTTTTRRRRATRRASSSRRLAYRSAPSCSAEKVTTTALRRRHRRGDGHGLQGALYGVRG